MFSKYFLKNSSVFSLCTSTYVVNNDSFSNKSTNSQDELYSNWALTRELDEVMKSKQRNLPKHLIQNASRGIKDSLVSQESLAFNQKELLTNQYHNLDELNIKLSKFLDNVNVKHLSIKNSETLGAVSETEISKALEKKLLEDLGHPISKQFRNSHIVVEIILRHHEQCFDENNTYVQKIDQFINTFKAIKAVFEFLADIDKSNYLSYVSRVNGTSGAGSKYLLKICKQALDMVNHFDAYSDKEIIRACIFKEPMDLYSDISAYLKMKRYLGDLWYFHQLMAAGNIGNAQGTNLDGPKTVVDGLSILANKYAFKSSDGELDRLHRLLAEARTYLMLPDIGVELDSSNVFSYNFGAQSFRPYEQSIFQFDPIPKFYQMRSKIDLKLKALAKLNKQWGVSYGAGASGWLNQIIAKDSVVFIHQNEFLSSKVDSNKVTSKIFSPIFSAKELNYSNQIAQTPKNCEFFVCSLVNSIDQITLSKDEVFAILKQAKVCGATVILDGAQAFGNVDLTFLGDVFDQFDDVPICVTGSMIKHLASGNGGFLFSNQLFREKFHSIGGWTEQVMGLKKNELVSEKNLIYGDQQTPIAASYLRFLEHFDALHLEYVKSLHQIFINKLGEKYYPVDFHRRNHTGVGSKTLVIHMKSEQYVQKLIQFLTIKGFTGLDYKNVNNQCFLRIGFSEKNTVNSVKCLADSISKFNDLFSDIELE